MLACCEADVVTRATVSGRRLLVVGGAGCCIEVLLSLSPHSLQFWRSTIGDQPLNARRRRRLRCRCTSAKQHDLLQRGESGAAPPVALVCINMSSATSEMSGDLR